MQSVYHSALDQKISYFREKLSVLKRQINLDWRKINYEPT